jgi:hypothetical protein
MISNGCGGTLNCGTCPDAGSHDAGYPDATSPDAGAADATTGSDSGTGSDAGPQDSSPAGLNLTAPKCGLVGDATNHVPSDSAWANFTPPAQGGTYTDPLYGCPVKRLTNNVGKGQDVLSVPQYALTGTFSATDAYALLVGADSGSWGVLDLNGNVVVSQATMSAALNRNHSAWRWDPTNDAVLWNTSGNVLYACTINASAHTLTCAAKYTFSEYPSSVVFPDESDVNAHGWVPMVGQATKGSHADLFMFNLSTLTKAAVAYTTVCTGDANSTQPIGDCVHKMTATPNDGFAVGFNSATELPGDRLWEPGFGGLLQIQSKTDHHSDGYDLNGNEVAAYEDDQGFFGSNGSTPIAPCTHTWNPVTVVMSASMVPNQARSCLIDTPAKGWHVSFLDYAVRPWIVYSTQASNDAERWNNDPNYRGPSTSGWAQYDNEILMVRVDANGNPGKTYRLALAHSRENEGYWAEPHAVVSRSGRYVAFGSNAAWGATGCGADSPDNSCSDVYLLGPLF